MLNFWYRLVKDSSNKISCILYKTLVGLNAAGSFSYEWLKKIQEILDKCDLSRLINEPHALKDIEYKQFKVMYKTKMRKWMTDEWKEKMEQQNKCSLYRNFKLEVGLEKYLLHVKEPYRTSLLKFRTSTHNLPIETGRHEGVARNERVCTICKSGDLGDEYHYFFICPKMTETRVKFIPTKLYKKPSVQKFCDLMKCASKKQTLRNAKFAMCIMKYVEQ